MDPVATDFSMNVEESSGISGMSRMSRMSRMSGMSGMRTSSLSY
jgi:hypothetical protein